MVSTEHFEYTGEKLFWISTYHPLLKTHPYLGRFSKVKKNQFFWYNTDWKKSSEIEINSLTVLKPNFDFSGTILSVTLPFCKRPNSKFRPCLKTRAIAPALGRARLKSLWRVLKIALVLLFYLQFTRAYFNLRDHFINCVVFFLKQGLVTKKLGWTSDLMVQTFYDFIN